MSKFISSASFLHITVFHQDRMKGYQYKMASFKVLPAEVFVVCNQLIMTLILVKYVVSSE
uniref:Uncharacterized protein n=1 Tax=Rhizophora mucronata TaxID=61149 RepID=A0A2P2Q585_RHIMU